MRDLLFSSTNMAVMTSRENHLHVYGTNSQMTISQIAWPAQQLNRMNMGSRPAQSHEHGFETCLSLDSTQLMKQFIIYMDLAKPKSEAPISNTRKQ